MTLFAFPRPTTVAACLEEAGARASVIGDASRVLFGVSALDEAEAGALCFCDADGEAALGRIGRSPAAAVIVRPEVALPPELTASRTLIRAEDPLRLFIACIDALLPRTLASGVSTGASEAADSALPLDVRVESGCHIDSGCTVGAGSEIHSGARLYAKARLGERVVVQSNAVIGAVGLAFGTGSDGSYIPFQHLGGVDIGSDVAIGPNSVIVGGILTATVIADGTKVGNLVNVGHNVKIGRHCFISAGAALCGSVVLEDGCWIAPGAVIANHVRVGAGAKVTLGAVVTRDVPAGAMVGGVPARALPRVS